MTGRAAVFLDRDGVINELVLDPRDDRPESPLHAADVRLIEGARDAVAALRGAGFLLVGASNQPAAAKGKATTDELREVHERVVELLGDAALDDWRYCLHRAQDGCACRKPKPGLVLDAAADHGIDLASSWMVGDADTDVEAGRAAGVRTVLVEHPESAHRRTGNAQPDATVRNLEEAAAFILGDGSSR